MKGRKPWRYNIDLSINEKNNLNRFFIAELNLFNSLNTALSIRVRQIPKGFIEMSKKLRIFGEVFEHNIDIRKALTEKEIPSQLKIVEDELIMLSEDALNILDVARMPCYISPRTKRNMGVQMFRFYAEQARAFTGTSLRFAPQLLENLDIIKKRHVQIHRKALIVEYDDENKVTTLKTPYTANPIKINADVKHSKWDIAIIHQEPNKVATSNTPWCVDLRSTSDDYLLTYLDNRNSNSAFNQSKNNYRSTSF